MLQLQPSIVYVYSRKLLQKWKHSVNIFTVPNNKKSSQGKCTKFMLFTFPVEIASVHRPVVSCIIEEEYYRGLLLLSLVGKYGMKDDIFISSSTASLSSFLFSFECSLFSYTLHRFLDLPFWNCLKIILRVICLLQSFLLYAYKRRTKVYLSFLVRAWKKTGKCMMYAHSIKSTYITYTFNMKK